MSHLFITRGDITKLASDAWLLPSDQWSHLSVEWLKGLSPQESALSREANSGSRGLLDVSRLSMPLDPNGPGDVRAWLTNVGHRVGAPVEWYLNAVMHFLDGVQKWLDGVPPRNGRQRHLVAMPLVGTGHGGASSIKGKVTQRLVSLAMHEAIRRPFDIAIVAFDARALAALQQTRLELGGATLSDTWPELDRGLIESVQRLAQRARSGELVLFLGAGVSASAGLPGWSRLLDVLAESAGMAADERGLLAKMETVDQARIVALRLEKQKKSLGEAVGEALTETGYGLSHSLLASLPVSEVATTNYDQLFERASEAAGQPVSVLPYQPRGSDDRWLLKMHGCVTKPEDIVLTRSDYLRYTERRAALAGIVQALLITRHMLFVGFSLTDGNFHRIADEVRRAMNDSGRNFGTALMVGRDPLVEQLWQPDLTCVGIGQVDGTNDVAVASRRQDIFLDALLALSTDVTSHLLDWTYDDVLTEGEKELRELLQALEAGVSEAARNTNAWAIVRTMLLRFGRSGPTAESAELQHSAGPGGGRADRWSG